MSKTHKSLNKNYIGNISLIFYIFKTIACKTRELPKNYIHMYILRTYQ